MKMSNRRKILEGCITQFKNENEFELNDSELFELFSLTQITKIYDLSHEKILSSIIDGGNDGGIDSILVLIDDEVVESVDEVSDYKFSKKTNSRIIISQCKKENSFKESTLDKLNTTVPELFNSDKQENELLVRFNADLVSLTLLVNRVWFETAKSGGKMYIDYIYSCIADNIEVNKAFESKTIQLIEQTKNIFCIENVTYSNYSCSELLQLYRTEKTNRLTLEFKEQPLSTSYKEYGIGYVGVVKLADYKRFLTSETSQIRDYLFESNIRHFQGEVDVNKKIKSTIENVEERDFWWLNNGITIIADSYNQHGKQLVIENPHIVNGLQTSYSIFNSHSGDLSDERSVLVKVIINTNKETIDSIIASTNSQNPVSATLLRATETTQRDIESFFLNKGYYYDRRKNYYKNQGRPASKIFSIQYTAQAIRSIVFNDPHSARAKPTSLVKDDVTYNQIFDSSKNFEGYLNCCLINKKSNDFWLNISDSTKKVSTANFKLHLAWISSKVTLSKYIISFDELSSFDLTLFDIDKFNEGLDFLLQSIKQFQEINTSANLINMAKSRDFTRYLIEKLEEKYKKNN